MRSVIRKTLFLSIVFIAGTLVSCKHDPITTDIDWELYEMALQTDGYTWFKNTNAALAKSSGSGHSEPYLRTRFNNIASTKLDSNGRVMNGTTFPNGSVIVKELLNGDQSIARYAILFKDPTNEYADANGWVWGYVFPGGKVAASATERGGACIGCHSQSGNIDYVLMNKFYP